MKRHKRERAKEMCTQKGKIYQDDNVLCIILWFKAKFLLSFRLFSLAKGWGEGQEGRFASEADWQFL